VLRFFEKWNRKLAEVDHLEAVADEYDHVCEKRGLVRFWNTWKKASELRTAEKVMVERVDLRIMNDAISVWKRQMYVNQFIGSASIHVL
jgi:protein SFI1